MSARRAAMDGNTAVAHVAYRVNEVCAIYPITPSSTMAELADEWATRGVKNVWGQVPRVQEMQSEGGAAGALHGALQGGVLTTTFTASQGLLLMIPNMFKIAGELTPTVFHVAARAVATSGLSIFGDHSDVMAVRGTGFALLCSGSVQEAHDGAVIAQAASLESRIPFLHFFDGFRTSHEVNGVDVIPDDVLRSMIRDDVVRAHRMRALSPERPTVRGTAHNPDTFFQAREAVNPYYERTAGIVEEVMRRFRDLAGREYRLFEWYGPSDAEDIVVIMGSGSATARTAAAALNREGRKVGVVQVRLYRPFDEARFLAALPPTCRRVAVLDRTKEPGGPGEPLYLDVSAALTRGRGRGQAPPLVVGGRYGLSSKEFTPAMARAVLENLAAPEPRNGFTVGIRDDVTGSSLPFDETSAPEDEDVFGAVFYALGSDGTVSANKNTAKIITERTPLHAQAYFVYDSHKSGAQTISHLRFGPRPVEAPYLVSSARFVACHRFEFIGRVDVLRSAGRGGTFLLNSPYGPEDIWDELPRDVQRRIIEKDLRFYVIDAGRLARELELGARVNTILQACFFALTELLPWEQATAHLKEAISKSYGRRGPDVVRRNHEAVDRALAHLSPVAVPKAPTSRFEALPVVPDTAPRFVREVTALQMLGRGDELPVSALPPDGTFPSGTARWEKRDVATALPAWDPEICIQCGQCHYFCPHSVIRARTFPVEDVREAPSDFQWAPVNARGFPDLGYALAFHVRDCTGCGVCVEVCPAHHPREPGRKALAMAPKDPERVESGEAGMAFFSGLRPNDRSRVDFGHVRGLQFLEPLFEFSGACGGCGETPYLRVLSQLFGDRLLIANATGCSSIYGGNQPVTPWSVNPEGRGPAWSNSLFEDNAEFGLGFRLAADALTSQAHELLIDLTEQVGGELVDEILGADQLDEEGIRAQRRRVARLLARLEELGDGPQRERLQAVADHLMRRSVWLVGGDGWAYDIGFGGLDHVLSTGANVNALVLDTEVYSNTGGQASKATPLGAVAKFAASGRRIARKDLALQMIAYGNVYVAQVSMGANPQQTLLALREAEAYPGPSLVLAYSPCIAHGFDLRHMPRQQDLATACGHWPLFRYNPAMRGVEQNPFRLDSPRPSVPFREYAMNELRYRILAGSRPGEAEELMEMSQRVAIERYRRYEELASLPGPKFHPDPSRVGDALGRASSEER